jgi:DNA-binding transcriptional ArsR family regulator
MASDPSTRAARLAKAFSHPLRPRLLFALDQAPASPSQLAARLGERLERVAYHMKRLEALGLIEVVSTYRVRGGVGHVYRTVRPAELDDREWTRLENPERQRLIDATSADILAGMRTADQAGTITADDVHISRSMMLLDPAARAAVNAILEATIEQCLNEQQASDARGHGRSGARRSMLAIVHVDLPPEA